MAEQSLFTSDGYLPIQSLQNMETRDSTPPDIKPSLESINLNMEGDISLGELNETLQKKQTNVGVEQTIEQAESTYAYKCIFCEMILTGKDDPKILECLHSACGNCTQQKLFESEESQGPKGFDCPMCDCFMPPEYILDNQFLNDQSKEEELNAKIAEIKCSSCNDDAFATSWCVDCAEFICNNCVSAHQRLKITKDHTIKSKEEGANESQTISTASPTQLFCTMHPHEKLALFCEYCDKMTCRDCQLMEHRDHKYKFTHEIASDTRKMIDAMLTDISYKRVLLNSAMKVIDDRQSLISDKKQLLVNEITNLVVNLTNTINTRGKQLVARLNEVCDVKQKTLDEKKIALDRLSKTTDHCIQFTRNILQTANDSALLYSKKHFTTFLQRVKSRRADIPNPEVPVRISLALDKVPDLMKVISSIGQIIVDGRVYPNQSLSPGAIPPQNSPSPNHQVPPQQPPPPPVAVAGPGVPVSIPTSNYPPNRMVLSYGPYGIPTSRHLGPMNMLSNRPPPNIMPPISTPRQLTPNMQANLQRMQQQQRSPYMNIMPPNMRMNSQQQVTSSTHPHGMMHERSSLRGLLQPNGSTVYVQTASGMYQPLQNMNQNVPPPYTNRFSLPGPYRQQNPLTHPSHMPPQRTHISPPKAAAQGFQSPSKQPPANKWHIPQQNQAIEQNYQNKSQTLPTLNNNFKILLKSQNASIMTTPTVSSSTIPKTPSPNHMQATTEKSLDKFCADSVNDLMATIAKLDSNGVQVLAESRPKTGGSPQVDSSTGDSINGTVAISGKLKNEIMEMGKDDPNEDWCAVCMDGGELVCCDKCPKVFHQFCHIPNLSVEESETWQCLLCMNFADVPDNSENAEGLTNRQKKIAERIILELYCQYEPSLPFREVIGPENTAYHEIIKNAIALDVIRHKLDWKSSNCYTSLEQLVRDVRQMFRNAYIFNPIDSNIYSDAKTLEKFFDEQLEKWLPEYAYEMFDDDEFQPPNKRYRRIISD